MTDAIADALAREEHAQGLPVGGHAAHCEACADAQQRLRRELCLHEDYADFRVLEQVEPLARICLACGARLTEEGS